MSVAAIFKRAGFALDDYSQAMELVRQHARIVAHFHPDRFGGKPANVADGLLTEGVYRNQFETGLSSGSPTAFPGGERDSWERTLFGGAYHAEGVLASERPKYGSLELIRYPDGPAPRFGSCYFVLRGVGARTSITFMGSEDPHATDRAGTLATPHAVMAALLAEIESGGIATPAWPPFRAPTLGMPGITVSRFYEFSRSCEPGRTPRGASRDVCWTLASRHKFTAPSYWTAMLRRWWRTRRSRTPVSGNHSSNSQISTDSTCTGTVDSGWAFAMYQMTSADRRCPGSQNASPGWTESLMLR